MRNISIYVHIPFCKQKCLYCDFCSFCCGENEVKQYFNKLKEEIVRRAKEFKDRSVQTIYFGGGTPSSVDADFIAETLFAIKKSYNVIDNAEITIECNPCSTDEIKLKKYFSCGFNRISFGVQSLDNNVLKSIGRLHNCDEAINAINLAKEVGFKNISCDLMIGLPEQDEHMLISDAERLDELGISHISCYMLQLEEGTPLFKKVKNGQIKVSDEDEQARMYDMLVKRLSQLGFEQYEVSNFAKCGKYSKHNLNYWKRGEYLGFGVSAHSFVGNKRFANADNFKDYYKDFIPFEEELSEEEIKEEKIMLGLRCFEGVEKKLIENNNKLKSYLEQGIIFEDGERYKLNQEYYNINNEIISSLF